MSRPGDEYGFGAALNAALRAYEQGARGSGRTTRMLQLLKDGDCVIAAPGPSANHLRYELRGRNVRVLEVSASASGLRSALEAIRGCTFGRVEFCHIWIGDYFKWSLSHVSGMLAEYAEEIRVHCMASPAPAAASYRSEMFR